YYYHNLPQYANGVKFITISTSLLENGSNEDPKHTILIKIPVGDEIQLNQAYVIKSLPGKNIVNKGDEYYINHESEGNAFIRYNPYLNYSQYLFGDGKVNFTKIIKKENGAEDIEGAFE